MSRLTTASAALAAAALVLTGCGGSTFKTDRPQLKLIVDEYRIVPQDIVVKPGRMKFVVRNTGRLTHNLVIQIPPKNPDGKPVLVNRTTTMQPGQTAAPIKVMLEPGEYRLVCTIANHDDLGQFGTLEVKR
ncbi:MAG: hypothetical protein QOK16_4572 [Solirubrobacteraceae bacterium]|nr:hypothetical protein [Solirubrobacteraceae bacterium]